MNAAWARVVRRSSSAARALVSASLLGATPGVTAHYVDSDVFVEPGMLSFAVALTGKPFAYRENGELRGFEIDVARAVAQAHGLELRVEQVGRGALLDTLTEGGVDAINTHALARVPHTVDTVPYLVVGDHALVLRGNPFRIRRVEDLSGRIVATTSGSTGERFARDVDLRLTREGLQAMVIHSFLDARHTHFPVSMGHAAAYFAPTVSAVGISQDPHSRTRLVEGIFEPRREVGFGIISTQRERRHAFEHAIAAMVATGKYEALRRRHDLPAELSPFSE